MPKLFTRNCPSCGAKVAISTDETRYTCPFCGKDQVLNTPPAPNNAPAPAAPRPDISQPAEVYLENDDQSIRLVRRWFHKGWFSLAVFCLLWDGFLFFWYWMALRTGASAQMFLGPIVHVIVGFILTYGLIAGLLNRTEITIDRQRLLVWQGPLPWWGHRLLPIQEIRQLFTKESKVKKNDRSTYNLFYIGRDGRSRKLLSGLDSPDTALFIEQQLEAWLNIPDHSVPDEVPRESALH